jgi:hypothetical protein
MNNLLLLKKRKQKARKFSSPALAEFRSGRDRRKAFSRRKGYENNVFCKKFNDGNRTGGERRAYPERRTGWFRIGKWNSSCLMNGA